MIGKSRAGSRCRIAPSGSRDAADTIELLARLAHQLQRRGDPVAPGRTPGQGRPTGVGELGRAFLAQEPDQHAGPGAILARLEPVRTLLAPVQQPRGARQPAQAAAHRARPAAGRGRVPRRLDALEMTEPCQFEAFRLGQVRRPIESGTSALQVARRIDVGVDLVAAGAAREF